MKQVVKVIWHKAAASLPHTDSSTVFAMWHQCGSLDPPNSISQTASQLVPVQPVLQTSESLCTLQWVAIFLFKIAHLHRESEPPQYNTWFLDPAQIHIPKNILINSAVFAGIMIGTDRQTDHVTVSVTIGHIYVVLVTWPNNVSQTSSYYQSHWVYILHNSHWAALPM